MNQKFIPQSKDELSFLGNIHIASRAIHIFSQFPIADFLIDKPKSIQSIAEQFNFDENALLKLLQILVSFNVLNETDKNLFSLTAVGKYLCHSHPESLKDFLFWDETRWNPLGKLDETLKTGKPSFAKVYGEDYFKYLVKHPNLQKSFDDHMKAVSYEENQILSDAIPLKENTLFIDIGGGEGGLVEAILKKRSSLQAILFDLPETINKSSVSEKYINRATCLKGSFFEPIPVFCDAVILKRVLHDWNDDKCIEILNQVKKILNPGGQVFIIENVLTGQDSPLTKMFDLFLLTVFGGKERTIEEYKNILDKAELTFLRCSQTNCSMSIIEVGMIEEKGSF